MECIQYLSLPHLKHSTFAGYLSSHGAILPAKAKCKFHFLLALYINYPTLLAYALSSKKTSSKKMILKTKYNYTHLKYNGKTKTLGISLHKEDSK